MSQSQADLDARALLLLCIKLYHLWVTRMTFFPLPYTTAFVSLFLLLFFSWDWRPRHPLPPTLTTHKASYPPLPWLTCYRVLQDSALGTAYLFAGREQPKPVACSNGASLLQFSSFPASWSSVIFEEAPWDLTFRIMLGWLETGSKVSGLYWNLEPAAGGQGLGTPIYSWKSHGLGPNGSDHLKAEQVWFVSLKSQFLISIGLSIHW